MLECYALKFLTAVKHWELTDKERVCIKALCDAGLWGKYKKTRCSHSVVKCAWQSIAKTGIYKMHQEKDRT